MHDAGVKHDEHRVLKFPPRTTDRLPRSHQPPTEPVAADYNRAQRSGDDADDFRHRMLTNIAALVFTIALTGLGIWLAVSIADLRRTQDCVLMGRRDCARVAAPAS